MVCCRCAICLSCGSNDPGFNCMWQKSFTECGPCASHTTCPSCLDPYNEGDLIIQCVQCERFVLPFYQLTVTVTGFLDIVHHLVYQRKEHNILEDKKYECSGW
jgi:hypothetical protein